MKELSLEKLKAFIVHAKVATYVGGASTSLSYRPNSQDLQFHEGVFSYLDSYSGRAIPSLFAIALRASTKAYLGCTKRAGFWVDLNTQQKTAPILTVTREI